MKAVGLCLILFSVFLLASCEDEEIPKPQLNYAYHYAPLDVGKNWVYSVDSIVYSDFSFPVSIDTFKYFVKNEITEVNIGVEGFPNYKISRFIKQDENSDWQLDRVFSVRKTKRELIKTDENLAVVDLLFPISEGAEWNGNAYNHRAEQNFRYSEAHRAANIGEVRLDSTVQVIRHEKKNLLEDEFAMEQYAANIGMVAKQEHFLKTNFRSEIQSGYRLKYQLVF